MIQIYMRKDKSDQQEGGEKCFAIHPLSFTFSRDQSHNYVLYFQKDLKILARCEIFDWMAVKEEKFVFEVPSSLQTVGAGSERELEFKWAFYIQRMTDNYQQEEYLESKKANLKWCWSMHDQYKNVINSCEINFGVVKLRFTYLFLIGSPHEVTSEAVEKYYNDNHIVPSKSKLSKPSLRKGRSSDMRKGMTLPELVMEDAHDYSTISDDWKYKSPSKNALPEIKVSDEKGTRLRVKDGRDSPLGLSKIDINDLGGTRRGDSLGVSLSKFNLTHSEIELTKDMERMLADSEEFFFRSGKTLEDISGNLDEPQEPRQFQNEKWITSSQFLDTKGEYVITPFYKQVKYWFIILAIFLIFTGLLTQGPKSRPNRSLNAHKHPHPKRDHRKDHKTSKKHRTSR